MNAHRLPLAAVFLSLFGIGELYAAPAGSNGEVPEGLGKSDWDVIRAVYEEGRHAFSPVGEEAGHWQAHNPGQQWTTTFDGSGFLATPAGGGWQWGLELRSYGIGETQSSVGAESPSVEAEGQSLSYDWDATVREWWINDSRGLEHGYVVARRPQSGLPDSASPLVLVMTTRGDLSPRIAADGRGVVFVDVARAALVNYGGLKVWDADGRSLPARFEAAGEKELRLVVEDAAARYPVTIDPLAQQAYLKASNTDAGDRFGTSVAVSGDTVVVGAPYERSNATGVGGNQADNSAIRAGAAYVFTRSGGIWTQQAYLKASNTGGGDNFGESVAVSGDTVVVGAYGEDSNATGIDGNGSDESASDAGAAYVFVRNGVTWTQQAYLKASNTGDGDRFGTSVAVSGDTVVVGAETEDSNATGVGGNQSDDSATWAGAAYVFARNGGIWTQQAYLKASNTDGDDRFGTSVAVSGDTVVVGARFEGSNATGIDGNGADNSFSSAGAAYVFTGSGGTWVQQAYLKASNTEAVDIFGISVAVSGDTVVVGAHFEDSNATGDGGNESDNSATDSGAAYVFARNEGIWTQQSYLKASNTDLGDGFGTSVAVSGDTVVVGARFEGSNAIGVGGNQAVNSAGSAGASYVFSTSNSSPSRIQLQQPRPFPTTQVGRQSRAVLLPFKNVGGQPATGIRGVVTGPARRDFRVSAPAASTLSPGASTTMSARFAPRRTGMRRATITVYSNAPSVTASLVGKGR